MKRLLSILALIAVLVGVASADWYAGGTTVTIANGAVTDAKLATDVKVGSLADLDTSENSSVVGAINETRTLANLANTTATTANTTANAAYVKPEAGINETDLASTVTDNLTLASTSMQGSPSVDTVMIGTVQLNGWAYTPIAFQADAAAVITGATDAVDLSGTGNGATIKLQIDSGEADTATLNCAAAYWTGDVSASTNMVGETDTKFKVSIDGAEAVTVTCDWSSANSGANVATAMQTALQTATGGSETVAYSSDGGDHYIITSTTLGTDSSVVVTRSDTLDCCDELDLIDGSETAGTGDCGDVTAVTVDELVTLLEGDIEGATFTNASGTLTATSDTTGRGSRVLAGAGTVNTAVGFPENEVDFGEIGLDYAADMSDANYVVQATMYGAAGDDLSITTKATSGFRITAETTSNTDYVDLAVFGVGA